MFIGDNFAMVNEFMWLDSSLCTPNLDFERGTTIQLSWGVTKGLFVHLIKHLRVWLSPSGVNWRLISKTPSPKLFQPRPVELPIIKIELALKKPNVYLGLLIITISFVVASSLFYDTCRGSNCERNNHSNDRFELFGPVQIHLEHSSIQIESSFAGFAHC